MEDHTGRKEKRWKRGPGPFLDFPFAPVEATLLVGLIEKLEQKRSRRKEGRKENEPEIKYNGATYLLVFVPTVHAPPLAVSVY
jgi:hypothetical protein